jgi:hypothetical protein
MSRYRVHIVPRSGRYAPLLTVLVEAGSADEAFQIAQVRCAGSKVVSAEDAAGRREMRSTRLQLAAETLPVRFAMNN